MNEMDEAKNRVLEKEIDLIQGCINRMAQNSFLIKGWMVAMVAVVLALAPESVDMRRICLLLLAATVCLWYLDAFYLKLEKLYRRKYEWVIQHRKYSFDYAYDLNPHNEHMWCTASGGVVQKPIHILCVMVSPSLSLFYGAIVALTICVWYFYP